MAHKPRALSSLALSLKKLPTAAAPVPIKTKNSFSALGELFGADGRGSTGQMTLGEVAIMKPSKPRSGKRAAISALSTWTKSAPD